MKVEYVVCDICGLKIDPGKPRYKYTNLVRYTEDTLGDIKPYEERLDVCNSCFDIMKAWIQAKKGAKNGTSA